MIQQYCIGLLRGLLAALFGIVLFALLVLFGLFAISYPWFVLGVALLAVIFG